MHIIFCEVNKAAFKKQIIIIIIIEKIKINKKAIMPGLWELRAHLGV